MTILEMIVFLSDKIREEFGTKYFGKDAFDFIKEQGIDKAMLKSIQNGIAYLNEKGAKPCERQYRRDLCFASSVWLFTARRR